MPGDPGAYTDLVDRVLAFKCGGQAADDPGSRPPRCLATIASRATTGIHGAVSAFTGIVTIAIIVIVWALFALHKLDIISAVSRRRSTGGPSAAGWCFRCARSGANSDRAGVTA
jgi:hypothetical protein